MNLEESIKSKFKDAVVSNNGQVIEVHFTKHSETVFVTYDSSNDRYAAGYPELVVSRKGDKRIEEGFSSNMLLGGLFWVLKQVNKYGKVKPEYE